VITPHTDTLDELVGLVNEYNSLGITPQASMTPVAIDDRGRRYVIVENFMYVWEYFIELPQGGPLPLLECRVYSASDAGIDRQALEDFCASIDDVAYTEISK